MGQGLWARVQGLGLGDGAAERREVQNSKKVREGAAGVVE